MIAGDIGDWRGMGVSLDVGWKFHNITLDIAAMSELKEISQLERGNLLCGRMMYCHVAIAGSRHA